MSMSWTYSPARLGWVLFAFCSNQTVILLTFFRVVQRNVWYEDAAGNTDEENSSVFSLIQTR